MYDATGVAQCHVRARKNIIRNCLSEDLDAQHICYYLLGLSLDIGVDECDVVVAANYVSER